VITQLVAEEMGVLPEDVNIIDRDTDVCPWDVGAHASRTTFVAGNAAVMAAKKVEGEDPGRLRGIRGRGGRKRTAPNGRCGWTSDPQNLVIRDRHGLFQKEPERRSPWGRFLRGAHYEKGGTMIMAECFYDPDNENLDRECKGNLSKAYAYGAHGVELEVTPQTAKVKIRGTSRHDVGRAINPMLLEGQIYGGAPWAWDMP